MNIHNVLQKRALVVSLLLCTGWALADESELDMATQPDGIRVYKNYRATPDSKGVLVSIPLHIPPFVAACYFSSDNKGYPRGANRVLPWIVRDFSDLQRKGAIRNRATGEPGLQGIFAVLQLSSGGWLALLPLAGADTAANLKVGPAGTLSVILTTYGQAPVACDVPLLSWATDQDLYAACRKAWAEALENPMSGARTAWRNQKTYPEAFEYLGWCSWEEYRDQITADLLVQALHKLGTSGLPFRWLLVDDGHLQAKVVGKGQRPALTSFAPNQKFPEGWYPLLSLRNPQHIRWMGLWLNFNGYWGGVSPENSFSPEVRNTLQQVNPRTLMPSPENNAPLRFYSAYLGAAADAGFDFLKIDDQAENIHHYAGTANPVRASRLCQEAKELTCHDRFRGLMNCMAHNTVCVFNTRYSAVTRCSIDYKAGDAIKGRSHLMQSFHNLLWMGQTVWGDHDMFHSSDKFAGRVMAVSKALSGGPIYLSDAPDRIITEYVRPLCYEDGRLLRPLAPAVVMPDSATLDALNDPSAAYRVMAPLANGCLAIAAYNLVDRDQPVTVPGKVRPADYPLASGMILPYPGPWGLPAEGLVVYDWYAGRGRKLEAEYAFELSGLSDKLLLLCPVKHGWAVIGRADKYLSPAAIESWRAQNNLLEVSLVESGPLLVWSERGIPMIKDAEVQTIGPSLYRINLPVAGAVRNITLTRSSGPDH